MVNITNTFQIVYLSFCLLVSSYAWGLRMGMLSPRDIIFLTNVCIILAGRKILNRQNIWVVSLVALLFLFMSISEAVSSQGLFLKFVEEYVLGRFIFSLTIMLVLYRFITRGFSINSFRNIMLVISGVTVVVLLGQLLGLRSFHNISYVLTGNELYLRNMERFEYRANLSGPVGAVQAGYMLVVFGAYLVSEDWHFFFGRLLQILLLLILMIVSVALGQRGAFGILLVEIVFFFRFFPFGDMAMKGVLALFILSFLDTDGLGRVVSYTDENRVSLYKEGLDFASKNWLIGDYRTFQTTRGESPHNVLLNSLIRAGIFGLLVTVVFYLRLAFELVKVAFTRFREFKPMVLTIAGISLLSLTHNAGLISADVILLVNITALITFRHLNLEK